jgi:tRNA U54 and U55 pseudouridine synthase Pus10
MNWRDLNEVLTDYTEQQVWDLLEDERKHARRSTVLIRLHQRFTTLRMLRERAELIKEIENDSIRSTTPSKRNHRRAR